MNETLKGRLIKAAGGGVLALSAVLISWHEGRVLTPYIDPVGVLTVCEGITGPDVIKGKTYSHAECDALRDKHIAIARAAVHRVITVPMVDKWMEAALIDWVYNFGEGALRTSTMAKKFNASDYRGGCDELRRWTKGRVKGQLVDLPGLVTRRGNEIELCSGKLSYVDGQN